MGYSEGDDGGWGIQRVMMGVLMGYSQGDDGYAESDDGGFCWGIQRVLGF